jgi:hypothetical protein
MEIPEDVPFSDETKKVLVERYHMYSECLGRHSEQMTRYEKLRNVFTPEQSEEYMGLIQTVYQMCEKTSEINRVLKQVSVRSVPILRDSVLTVQVGLEKLVTGMEGCKRMLEKVTKNEDRSIPFLLDTLLAKRSYLLHLQEKIEKEDLVLNLEFHNKLHRITTVVGSVVRSLKREMDSYHKRVNHVRSCYMAGKEMIYQPEVVNAIRAINVREATELANLYEIPISPIFITLYNYFEEGSKIIDIENKDRKKVEDPVYQLNYHLAEIRTAVSIQKRHIKLFRAMVERYIVKQEEIWYKTILYQIGIITDQTITVHKSVYALKKFIIPSPPVLTHAEFYVYVRWADEKIAEIEKYKSVILPYPPFCGTTENKNNWVDFADEFYEDENKDRQKKLLREYHTLYDIRGELLSASKKA